MPYTKEEFEREGIQMMIKDPIIHELVRELVAMDERLEGLPIEELMWMIPMEKIVKKKMAQIPWLQVKE